MLSAMEGANKFIYWESYILLDDTPRYDFFEILKRKAREGVAVKVIVDGFGSWWLRSGAKEELARVGGEILVFNRLWPFPRTHRKILIVDGTVGFLGGVNVAKIFENWLDLQIELRGRGILRHFLRSFARAYTKAGGKDSAVLAYDRTPPNLRRASERAKVWFLEHWPVRGKHLLRKYYRERISQARESVVIVTPYFIPHRWLHRSLVGALRRGAIVKVLIPRKTDGFISNLANYIFAGLNEPAGIQFFLVPQMVHAKALLVDGQEGLIGSNNIDAQSFEYNVESSIIFERKDMIGNFRNILEGWERSAERFQPARHLCWYHRAFTGLFKLLQPIL